MHLRIHLQSANALHLVFDDLSGVLVVSGPMPGDEKSYFRRFGLTGKRMFLDDLARAGQQNLGHAFMRSYRATIVNRLVALLPLSIEGAGFSGLSKPQFSRDDFLGEVAFADKQRNNKNSWRERTPQNPGDTRFLLPEALQDLGEGAAAAQFIRVLVGWGGGIRV